MATVGMKRARDDMDSTTAPDLVSRAKRTKTTPVQFTCKGPCGSIVKGDEAKRLSELYNVPQGPLYQWCRECVEGSVHDEAEALRMRMCCSCEQWFGAKTREHEGPEVDMRDDETWDEWEARALQVRCTGRCNQCHYPMCGLCREDFDMGSSAMEGSLCRKCGVCHFCGQEMATESCCNCDRNYCSYCRQDFAALYGVGPEYATCCNQHAPHAPHDLQEPKFKTGVPPPDSDDDSEDDSE